MLARTRVFVSIQSRTYPRPGEPRIPSGKTIATRHVLDQLNAAFHRENFWRERLLICDWIAWRVCVALLVIVVDAGQFVLFKDGRVIDAYF